MFELSFEDNIIKPIDYECDIDNTILPKFNIDIPKNSYIGCSGINETGLMPYDLYSYLPVIPFNDVKISMIDAK